MRAVYYDAFDRPPVCTTVADPVCPATGVVIEVVATGLCRSDWHAWMGHDRDVTLPHVPGHEFAGLIAEVGSSVEGWGRGDRVTVPFVCACGRCDTCRRGEQQVCDDQFQPGFTHWGSFAEFVAIDRAQLNLIRVPDSMELDIAASLGCRFATAYRAVDQHARVGAGDWVAVHGCGGVGLSAVMIAAARGARVIAVDPSGAALALASTAGAVATIDPAEVDPVAAIRELTGGGARVSIDALGSVVTCRNSIRCLRKRGRHVQIGLLAGADAMPALPMSDVIAGELELIGSHGMPAHAYPAMLAEISDGSLHPGRLITHRITLAEAAIVLARMGDLIGDGVTMVQPKTSTATS